MTPEQIQVLLDRLFEIGGAMASKGWELALKQVYVGAATDAAWLVVCVAAIVLGHKWAKWANAQPKEKFTYSSDMMKEGPAFALGGAIALMIGGAVGVPFLLTNVAQRLINPQWQAVQLLLGLVK